MPDPVPTVSRFPAPAPDLATTLQAWRVAVLPAASVVSFRAAATTGAVICEVGARDMLDPKDLILGRGVGENETEALRHAIGDATR